MKAEAVLKASVGSESVTFKLPQNEGLRKRFCGALAQCFKRNGGYALVAVQPPVRPRSTGQGSQNHHVNGHIGQIAEETGMPFDMVKIAVKSIAIGMGYPFETIGSVAVAKSEALCSMEECGILIEAAHVLAADLRIILREAE